MILLTLMRLLIPAALLPDLKMCNLTVVPFQPPTIILTAILKQLGATSLNFPDPLAILVLFQARPVFLWAAYLLLTPAGSRCAALRTRGLGDSDLKGVGVLVRIGLVSGLAVYDLHWFD